MSFTRQAKVLLRAVAVVALGSTAVVAAAAVAAGQEPLAADLKVTLAEFVPGPGTLGGGGTFAIENDGPNASPGPFLLSVRITGPASNPVTITSVGGPGWVCSVQEAPNAEDPELAVCSLDDDEIGAGQFTTVDVVWTGGGCFVGYVVAVQSLAEAPVVTDPNGANNTLSKQAGDDSEGGDVCGAFGGGVDETPGGKAPNPVTPVRAVVTTTSTSTTTTQVAAVGVPRAAPRPPQIPNTGANTGRLAMSGMALCIAGACWVAAARQRELAAATERHAAE